MGQGQIEEAETALALCPNHPDADAIRARIAGVGVDQELEEEGRLFGSGLYRVGQDIQPGSYVTTDVEDCYWERQDEAGAIIDNYFGTALRVEVYIAPSDCGFLSQDCGQCRPL